MILIVSLWIFIGSIAVATASTTATSPRADSSHTLSQTDRQLIWSETGQFCSPSTLAFLADPTITVCFEGALQWDPQGILTATWLQVTRPTPFLDTILQIPTESYSASYNGNLCNSFAACEFVNDGTIVRGQYSYDCR